MTSKPITLPDGTTMTMEEVEIALEGAMDDEASARWRYGVIVSLIERVRELEADKGRVMVGGNHLATFLLSSGVYPERIQHHDDALDQLTPEVYEVWCCWRAIMEVRDVELDHGANT